ncbi:TetR/AcrR family transcriptional regulator [Burkholderia multivorans]|nr:TetR/AcrR family transcriptional regulator [Burkholderia multivorans]
MHVAAGRHTYGDPASGRERLLDIAIDLFADRGIANTTVAQIAAAGKVTSAMVHYWFETRDKLYDAIVEERLVPQIRAIWSPADLQRESACELVHGLLARMFSVTAAAPWLPSLWLREIIQVGGLLQERVLRRIPQELNSTFRSRIADAQSRGEINPRVEPDLLFISLLALVMLPQAAAQGWNKVRPGRGPSREQIEAHTSALVTAGLIARTPLTSDKASQ